MQFVHNLKLLKAKWLLYVPPIKILHCVQTIHLCVWYGTQNKKQLFPCIVKTGRFNKEHGGWFKLNILIQFRLTFLFQGSNKRKQNMLLKIKQLVYSIKNGIN